MPSAAKLVLPLDPVPVVIEQTSDEQFAHAFDDLDKLGEREVPDGVDKIEGEPNAPDATTQPDASTDPGAPAVPVPKPGAAPDPGAPAPAPAAGEPPAPDPGAPAHVEQPRLSEDELRRIAEYARPPIPQAPPVPQAPPPPEYSQAEQEYLATYHKDWEVVARGEALMRRGEYKQLTAYIFSQVAEQFRQRDSVLGTVAEHSHLDTIYTLVPDYDEVRDPAIAWAQKQPDWMQPSIKHVIQEGEPREIAGLINMYRQSIGAPLTPGAPVVLPKPVKPGLTPEAAAAAAALAPIQSKRSGVQAGLDPADFESAFDKFDKLEQ